MAASYLKGSAKTDALTVTGASTLTGTVTATAGIAGPALSAAPVDCTASTLTITQATHAGRMVTLNRAAGIAVTLPAATGTGSVYRFLIGTTVTSNATTIKVANATDVMTGSALVISDDAAAVLGYKTAASSDTVSFNGSTTGGILGDVVEVEDVGAGLFRVTVVSSATGTEATPFSATVS